MIKDKPLTGYWADGGFQANYLDYQANYFRKNQQSYFSMLAGNIKHPFNEYILLCVNYGLIGLILLLLAILFVWKSYCRNQQPETLIAGLCLLSIAIISCFSYPFSYPFVWVLCGFSLYLIIINVRYKLLYPSWINKLSYIIAFPLLILSILYLYKFMYSERRWCEIANKALHGQTEEVFPEYKQLYSTLKNNPLFLYNYAAELNYATYYSESIVIAKQCKLLMADYDLSLLLADNYFNLKKYKMAEQYYLSASYMCPSRFIPLYQLCKIYELNMDTVNVRKIALKIINKPVKINSVKIEDIKSEMKFKYEKFHYNKSNNLIAINYIGKSCLCTLNKSS